MKVQTIMFLILCGLYLSFSFSLYIVPQERDLSLSESPQLAQGKLVWQKYNCQSCHQLYGLGGYLGPDLSLICSDSIKGPALVSAIVRSGNPKMPAFNLTDNELSQLVTFLTSIAKTGGSQAQNYKCNNLGLVVEND